MKVIKNLKDATETNDVWSVFWLGESDNGWEIWKSPSEKDAKAVVKSLIGKPYGNFTGKPLIAEMKHFKVKRSV